jgi:hypothetical protein
LTVAFAESARKAADLYERQSGEQRARSGDETLSGQLRTADEMPVSIAAVIVSS